LYWAIEEERFPSVICWSQKGGQYFVIYSMDEFKKLVLKEYFKTTAFSTFIR
jgi:hypothetical protein